SFLLYLEGEQVEKFISNIDNYVRNPSSLYIDFPDFWAPKSSQKESTQKESTEDKSARRTIAAIKKRIAYLIEEDKGLHSDSSNLINDVLKYLKEGKTVIIDLSLNDTSEASIISTILVRELFEHNKRYFSSNEPDEIINAVIFMEEAQNVLSDELVRSNANPFVRLAKEGRKFGLGLVAITQRPSAISEEIRTQAENFFTFHMGNSDDIKALVKSNINYDGVISKFVQTETIKGNLYMVSSEQAFVLPVRAHRFEKLVGERVAKSLKLKNE
ncbi:MAG: zonular occludens toxin domain-containing protein, partial [Pseudomonadota bacterium]